MKPTPPWLPVHTFALTAGEAAAVEKAIGCVERALDRLREAQGGVSIYGRDALHLAKVSIHVAFEALHHSADLGPAPESSQ